MADLKFIECNQRRSLSDMQNGQLTDYMFMMYRKGEDGWYKNTLLSCAEFTNGMPPQTALCGICVSESLRVTCDKDGKAAFFSAESVLALLSERAKSVGLTEPDTVYASYALRELIKLERGFLSENSELIVHISLYSVDKLPCFPTVETMFTITLEYREKKTCECSAITDACCFDNENAFQSLQKSGIFRARLGAQAAGYDDALLLDSVYKKYLLSLGGSALFFRLENEIILTGACGDMLSELALSLIESWGLSVSRRKLSTDELARLYRNGEVQEVFCVGMEDFVRAVSVIDSGDNLMEFETGKLSKKLTASIYNIESGVLPCAFARFERI